MDYIEKDTIESLTFQSKGRGFESPRLHFQFQWFHQLYVYHLLTFCKHLPFENC